MSTKKRIVEAEEFVVRDSHGLKRAALGMQGEEPVLALYDAKGQTRIVLRVTAEVSGGAGRVVEGAESVALSLTAGSEGLAFFNADGKPHLIVLGMADGTSFYVYDSNTRARLRIDVREGGSAVSCMANPVI